MITEENYYKEVINSSLDIPINFKDTLNSKSR